MELPALTLDARSLRVAFAVRWFTLPTVRGAFRQAWGDVQLDDSAPGGVRIEARVESSSVTSGIALRDRHLRGPRFLHADLYPFVGFRSTAVRREAGELVVEGVVTLRGVSRAVRASCPIDELRLGTGRSDATLCARFQVSRAWHGIGVPPGILRFNPLFVAIADAVQVRVEMSVPTAMLTWLGLVPQPIRPRAATGHDDST